MDARLDRLPKRLASRVDAAAAGGWTRRRARRAQAPRGRAKARAGRGAQAVVGAAGGDSPTRQGGAWRAPATWRRARPRRRARGERGTATARRFGPFASSRRRSRGRSRRRGRERRRERREARGEGGFEGPGAGRRRQRRTSFSGFWADRGAPGGLRDDGGGGALSAGARAERSGERARVRASTRSSRSSARGSTRAGGGVAASAAIESLRRAAAKAEAVSYRGGARSAAPRPGRSPACRRRFDGGGGGDSTRAELDGPRVRRLPGGTRRAEGEAGRQDEQRKGGRADTSATRILADSLW